LLAWAIGKRRSIVRIATILIVASFLLNIAMVARHGPATFFLLPTRLWELLAGGLLWCLLTDPRRVGMLSARARNALSLAGVAILATGFAFLSSQRHYPGSAALLPVIGTCCIIAAGNRAWINRTLLAHRGPVFIGLISYPLYLWHWPALAFLRIAEGGAIGVIPTCLALAAAVALAVATFVWIERPIRRSRHRAVPWLLLAAMAVIGALGLAGAQGWIEARTHAGGFERFNAAAMDWEFPGPAFKSSTTTNGVALSSVGTGTRQVLLVGDSNAMQYGPRMERLVQTHPEANVQVIFATKAACPPLPGVRRDMRPQCAGFADGVVAFARDAAISDVIFAAQWTGYFDPESLIFVRDDGTEIRGDAAIEPVLERFGAMIRDLKANGKNVYFVANIPIGTEFDPHYVLHRQWSGDFAVRGQGVPRKSWDDGVAKIVAPLVDTARRAGAIVIDPADALCGRDACRAVTPDGEPIYRDGFHLRATYVREQVRYLDSIVLGR
jgi:SGNH domain (fused to AT3 domains)